VSESGFTSKQRKKVKNGREKHRNRSEWVNGALRPSNAKRLYTDE